MPIRPNVQRMIPYSPGKPVGEVQRELGLTTVYKLASNENPFGPSPKAVAAVKVAAESMHVYPDGAAYDLKSAIAAKFDVARERIAVGNGSDELIHLLGMVLLGDEEDEVLVGDPGFSRYHASAFLAPCRLVKVPLDRGYVHDLPAMGRAITDRTKLVFIANPNNPTGTIVRKREFEAFLSDVPEDVAVVMDEAYFEFGVADPDFPLSLDYLKAGHSNVIGLRTFSKAYGLAGIRIGFGFMDEAIVDAIDRAREPFNANSLAMIAGIAALDDDEHVEKTVAHNRRSLAELERVMFAAGATPCKSFANFLFVDVGRPATPIFEGLMREGVIVRDGSVFNQPNCLRITVGTAREMQAFVEAFEKVMATMPAMEEVNL